MHLYLDFHPTEKAELPQELLRSQSQCQNGQGKVVELGGLQTDGIAHRASHMHNSFNIMKT